MSPPLVIEVKRSPSPPSSPSSSVSSSPSSSPRPLVRKHRRSSSELPPKRPPLGPSRQKRTNNHSVSVGTGNKDELLSSASLPQCSPSCHFQHSTSTAVQQRAHLSRSDNEHNINKNNHAMAGFWNHKGNLHFRKGQYQQAREAYQCALDCCKSASGHMGNKEPLTDALANLGAVYWATGDAKKAIKVLHKALATHELDIRAAEKNQHEDIASSKALPMATIYHQLGLAYCLKQDINKALASLTKAHNIFQSFGYIRAAAKSLNALGQVVFVLSQQTETALAHHQQALELMRSIDSCGPYVISTLRHIATIHEHRNEWQHALTAWHEVLKMQKAQAPNNSKAVGETLVIIKRIRHARDSVDVDHD